MRSFPTIFALAALLALAAAAIPVSGAPEGAYATGRHRNLFRELLGKSEQELDAKLNSAWQQLFYGNDADERLYYPVGTDEAYLADVASRDVRTEGMSYGLMIAVQLDHREEFDRLWKWARTHMYHPDGPRQGYFAWHCGFDGRVLDPGSASDGEEWFAMSLFFAAGRWRGGTGLQDYRAQAQELLRTMLHRADGGDGSITSIFDRPRAQVVFAPTRTASTFTDPSYHLPAFYELWSRWADADADFWVRAARTSREFFHRAAHPRTGLMPEYAGFDGQPRQQHGRGDFRFDAWRTPANVGLDYAWFAADPWQVGECNRVLDFLASQGPSGANQFTLDGKPLSTDHSLGLDAMAAVAGLAADPDKARPLVQRLWDAPVPRGPWRYYDGMLYLLGLLEAGGRFRIYPPPAAH
jgi:oligosaccharide reducing-end xylanase